MRTGRLTCAGGWSAIKSWLLATGIGLTRSAAQLADSKDKAEGPARG